MTFTIENIQVTVEGKKVLNNIGIAIAPGEVHVLMGPNGSGKSSLANALMGHPKYHAEGSASIDGVELLELPADERAKQGLFLSFQHPPEIPGVSVESFLRMAYNTGKGKSLSVIEFHKLLKSKLDDLQIDHSFAARHLNEGFSGGERKRMEILQMSILEPKYAILDETDSGLDVDALKIVASAVQRAKEEKKGILLITHFTRILKYIQADKVHILKEGNIVKTGGAELAHDIELHGFTTT